jgi:hypothetical protein
VFGWVGSIIPPRDHIGGALEGVSNDQTVIKRLLTSTDSGLPKHNPPADSFSSIGIAGEENEIRLVRHCPIVAVVESSR